MIPDIEILTEEITEPTYEDRTYRIAYGDEQDRISGYIEELEALKQTIYIILNVERYEHIIYSWDFGVEILDLYGQPIPYVMAELPRRITEALTMDDRIDDVVDFEFERNRNKLHTTFTVVSNLGNIDADLEVTI